MDNRTKSSDHISDQCTIGLVLSKLVNCKFIVWSFSLVVLSRWHTFAQHEHWTACSASITVMFITNELVVSGVVKTPNLVKSSLKDVELFSRDAHNQIVNAVHDGIDTSIERIKYDLKSEYYAYCTPHVDCHYVFHCTQWEQTQINR